MKTDVSGYISRVHTHRKLRHRAAAFLTALSVLVSASVFWQLRSVGTAMVDSELCALQEHKHTEECYEERLICGLDEADELPEGEGEADAETEGHHHTPECYEKVLVCGFEEHVHTEDCTPDLTADTETQEQWEATLPAELRGDVRERLVQIARSQLGYKQSSSNFHFINDEEKSFYTRYGEWYGNPYGEWNPMFAYFCMYYAGVDKQTVPYGSGCMAWQAELERNGLLQSITQSEPSAGDVILLDSDLDGKADSCAIISEVWTDEDRVLLSTIRGNVAGAVAQIGYELTDEHITGFVDLKNSDGSLSFEQTSEEGITVSAEADKGTFPAGTTMTVADIPKEDAVSIAEDGLGEEREVVDAVAVDITFRDENGTEIEPAEGRDVRVQLKLPENMGSEDDDYSLLHVIGEDNVQKVENASVSAEGAEFETESFSIYVLARNKNSNTGKDADYRLSTTVYLENGWTGDSSQDNPYVIYKDDELVVRYKGTYLNTGRFTVFHNDPNNCLPYDPVPAGQNHLTRIGNGDSPITTDDGGERYIQAVFRGNAPGRSHVGFLKDGAWSEDNIDGGLWVKVVEPIYVLTKDKDYQKPANLTMADNHIGDNSEAHPYMIYVGEELTLKYDGEFKDTQPFKVIDNNGDILEIPSGDLLQNVTFTGKNAGLCRIVIENGYNSTNLEENIASSLWVKVIDPIYVNTYYGEKGKDWIREYLGGYDWISDKNGYIQNTSGKRYLLRVGDTFTVRSNATGAFEIAVGDSHLEKISEDPVKGTVTYRATDPGDAEIRHRNTATDTVNDTLYVRVLSETMTGSYTHCDMEIADDGQYTLTEFKGEVARTETVYRAYVTKINSDTILRDENGSEVSRMPVEAYRTIGIPEHTQYEMTSAYYVNNFAYEGDVTLLRDQEPNKEYDVYNFGGRPHFEPNGTPVHSAYLFDPNKIKSVDFDVQITLYPFKQIDYDENNNSTETSIENGEPQVIESAKVHFEGQPLIDAMNKCPLDNGLDFTYKPQGALVKLKAKKELDPGVLKPKEGEFNFEIHNEKDADGYAVKKVASDSTISAADLFPDYKPGDTVKAYKLFNHNNGGSAAYQYTNTFDIAAMEALYPQYKLTTHPADAQHTEEWTEGESLGFVNLIDRITEEPGANPKPDSVTTNDISAGEYYDLLLRYADPNKAIALGSDGSFNLEAGHYFFTHEYAEDYIAASGTNDADGNVEFTYLIFTEQDKGKDFIYTMSEVPDPNNTDIENFDSNSYTVTIHVGDDMKITVTYEGDKEPTFTNKAKAYQLPNTGGIGIMPFMTLGGALMTGSVVLLIRRRRREAG